MVVCSAIVLVYPQKLPGSAVKGDGWAVYFCANGYKPGITQICEWHSIADMTVYSYGARRPHLKGVVVYGDMVYHASAA